MKYFFNPELFLKVAKKIRDLGDIGEQVKLRTVIGRAYYAAFLSTREYLKRHKGKTFGREQQHQDVINALDEADAYDTKNFLETLRDSRIKVDYFLNVLIDKNLCEKSIILSEQIIESLEGI